MKRQKQTYRTGAAAEAVHTVQRSSRFPRRRRGVSQCDSRLHEIVEKSTLTGGRKGCLDKAPCAGHVDASVASAGQHTTLSFSERDDARLKRDSSGLEKSLFASARAKSEKTEKKRKGTAALFRKRASTKKVGARERKSGDFCFSCCSLTF